MNVDKRDQLARIIGVLALVLGLWGGVERAPIIAQSVMPTPYQTVLDDSGAIASSACVWVYEAGTTTAATTYTDEALTTANTNPIIADSAGRFTAFLVAGQSYKFVYEAAPCSATSHGSVLKTVDDVIAAPSNSGGVDVVGTAGAALSAGDVVYLSDGSGSKTAGQWYPADNANAYSSTTNPVGMVTAPIASGATGTIRVSGTVGGLSSLTIGLPYYVGASGAITSTEPTTHTRRLGLADTTSSLVLQPDATRPIRGWTTITTTDTGTQDDWDPGLVGDTILRCNNATDLTITGIAAGYDGQRLQLVSVGAGNVFLADEDSGSDAANQLKNFVTSGKTPLAAGVGTATYIYDGTADEWRLVQHEQGAPIDYTASSTIVGWGSFTDGRKLILYTLRGTQLLVQARIEGTSNATSTSFTLPFTAISDIVALSGVIGFAEDNGTILTAQPIEQVTDGSSVMTFSSTASGTGAWTASGAKVIDVTITVPVQ